MTILVCGTSVLLENFSYVCVVYKPMYLCNYMSVGACMYSCMWRPKVKIMSLP